MDQRIWSRLPEDIIEHVLEFLQLAESLRFRCVSKSWKSMLSSPRRSIESSGPPSLLCFTTVGSPLPVVRVFNIESCNWNELPLSFLPPDVVDVSVISSEGGLVYLRATASNQRIYLTCNPLTKTWRKIPPNEISGNESVESLASLSFCHSSKFEQENNYKIIEATCPDRADFYMSIYHSSTRSWSPSGTLSIHVLGFQSGVFINQCFYCATYLPSKLLKVELGGVVTQYSELSAGLPAFAVHPQLVNCCGSLAVVAGFDSSYDGRDESDPVPEELKIWRLNESAVGWEEIATMPRAMREAYLSKDCFDSLICAGHGRAIFVSNYDGKVAFVYNLTKDSWNVLPECPYLSDGQSVVESMFIYNPSLHSIA